MAKIPSFLLFAFSILVIGVFLIYAQISVPAVPDPTCVGGFTTSGEYIPKELGGCCKGTECCKYEAFKNNLGCASSNPPSCSGLDCCQYAEYENTPLCSCSGKGCCQYAQYKNSKVCSCLGLDCCRYEEYEKTPLCSCSGSDCCQYAEYKGSNVCSCSGSDCCKYAEYSNTALCSCSGKDCCQYEEYENSPVCSCSGLGCCQYEEYESTPLCVVQPTQSEDECAPTPPECPIGGGPGVSAPMLLDPAISSNSKCRGACGPDCPSTCEKTKDKTLCIPDSKGKCFYVCTYSNVLSCAVHDGCETHDDCYDACAAQGENRMCYAAGLCHCACDLGCYFKYGAGNCWDWMNGKGPSQRRQLYSSPPLRSKALSACPQTD